MTYKLIHGECIQSMLAATPSSVHAIVCDPPYMLEFMGKSWDSPKMLGMATGVSGGFQGIPAGTPRPDVAKGDSQIFQQWCTAWGEAALRVLKPGGYALVFGSPRTAHRLVAGLEDAGFEVRDTIMWIYGEGMPKGKDLTVEIDKHLGVEREVVGERDPTKVEEGMSRWNEYRHDGKYAEPSGTRPITVPTSDEAKRWAGWSTCLKPMHEPIVVLRKPNAPGTTRTGRVSKKPMTNAQNLITHGVGALNVDACRVPHSSPEDLAESQAKNPGRNDAVTSDVYGAGRAQQSVNDKGRAPGNVIIDEEVAELLEGERKGRSRYFYCGKVKPKEKHAGVDGKNVHPTPKPIALMEYLVRLVTPEGGVVLDPFMGSGSTGIAALLAGFNFVGIELDGSYVEVARQRIAHWAPEQSGKVATGVLPVAEETPIAIAQSQSSEPSFDIYCSNGDCGIGIDPGRELTEEEKALSWLCGPCIAATQEVVPA